jgi:CRISPR-associated endoribonuclease Cas6
MRFKITMNRTGRQRMLPMDYQYYLSAWIYKVFGTADREFARFLHEEGYQTGYRQFRFFNYSSLDFGKPVLWKDKRLFEIRQDQLVLNISFLLSEAAEKFIIGLFNNQKAYIGDKFNGLELVVSQVERLPEPELKREMIYSTNTPVVIGLKGEEDKFAQYLSPEDVRYSDLFLKHLRMKYQALPAKQEEFADDNMYFKLLSDSRSKLVTIKPDTPQQSRVKGYLFDFELSAPEAIHQLVLACGAGEKGSVGFGWCEEIQ